VADAVVIVDTSTSMRQPGMDPERASLLVTKLPRRHRAGNLAVIRLLDIDDDSKLIPSHTTGQSMPCSEDPTQICKSVEADTNWEAEARSKMFGALPVLRAQTPRTSRRSNSTLAQRVNNSMFYLAFAPRRGVFDTRRKNAGSGDVPRTIVWLSDGRSDGPDVVRREIGELTADGVAVEAVVFGRATRNWRNRRD